MSVEYFTLMIFIAKKRTDFNAQNVTSYNNFQLIVLRCKYYTESAFPESTISTADSLH